MDKEFLCKVYSSETPAQLAEEYQAITGCLSLFTSGSFDLVSSPLMECIDDCRDVILNVIAEKFVTMFSTENSKGG